MKRNKIIADQIYYIAKDKRGKVLKDDHIEWLTEKLKEIKRLSKLLPRENSKAKKYIDN